MNEWLVVTNRRAGGGRSLRDLDRVLDTVGLPHARIDPESLPALRTGVLDAIGAGTRQFAAVGGDGTLNLVVDTVLSHQWDEPPTVAVLPGGTGSDFARMFALPQDLQGAAARLVTPTRYRCDVGVVHGAFGTRHFVNVLNIGVVARAAVVGARLPTALGVARYRTAFWAVLPFHRPAPITVDLGRRKIEGRGLNVVVANGQFFGGGFNIAPQAAAMDGHLDTEVFVCRRRDAFSLMARVARGGHLRHPAVRRGRSTSVDVTVPETWTVEGDGEFFGTGPVRIDVRPGAIDFVI